MPLLAAWIGSLVTSIASFFAQWLSKRVAMVAAAVVAISAFTITMIASIQALYAGIAYAAPSWLVIGWGWLVPDNADNCMAAYITAITVRWAYDWNTRVIQYKLL